jgi:hypothetical protein
MRRPPHTRAEPYKEKSTERKLSRIPKFGCAALALIAALGIAPAVHADTLYSNFAPGYTDSGNAVSIAGSNAGGEYYAESFTPTTTETFSDALADLLWFQGTDTVSGYLLADDNGLPGSSIATLTQTTPITNGIEMFTSASDPVLNAGTQYWFELIETDPNTDIGWYVSSVDLTNTGDNAQGFTFYPSGSWWWPNEPRNVFEIDGTPLASQDPDPDPTPAPEPGILALLVLGVGALFAVPLVPRARQLSRALRNPSR